MVSSAQPARREDRPGAMATDGCGRVGPPLASFSVVSATRSHCYAELEPQPHCQLHLKTKRWTVASANNPPAFSAAAATASSGDLALPAAVLKDSTPLRDA